MSIEKTADSLFLTFKAYLEKRLGELPAPRDGKDGVNGATGLRGLDGAPGADGKPGVDGERGAQGEKGMDGAAGARGEQGPPGDPGPQGDPGERGAPGADGKDGDPGRDGIDGAKGMDGAQGLPGTDGTPGMKGMDGDPGRDGRDGPPGRDAAQIDILPSINEERSYGRGTYASHKGGLWWAQRPTQGMDGWKCVVEGDSDEEDMILDEDGRTFTFRKIKSSGRVFEKSFVLPTVIDRGVFKEGTEYVRGDCVTWDGSSWIAQEKTIAKPDGGGKAWRLAVKHGRNGRDGRDGIDMTKPVKL